jgi:hypothetical protein
MPGGAIVARAGTGRRAPAFDVMTERQKCGPDLLPGGGREPAGGPCGAELSERVGYDLLWANREGCAPSKISTTNRLCYMSGR